MAERLFGFLIKKIFIKGWNGTLTVHVADGVPLKFKAERSYQVGEL
jgi:hypothetical protein